MFDLSTFDVFPLFLHETATKILQLFSFHYFLPVSNHKNGFFRPTSALLPPYFRPSFFLVLADPSLADSFWDPLPSRAILYETLLRILNGSIAIQPGIPWDLFKSSIGSIAIQLGIPRDLLGFYELLKRSSIGSIAIHPRSSIRSIPIHPGIPWDSFQVLNWILRYPSRDFWGFSSISRLCRRDPSGFSELWAGFQLVPDLGHPGRFLGDTFRIFLRIFGIFCGFFMFYWDHFRILKDFWPSFSLFLGFASRSWPSLAILKDTFGILEGFAGFFAFFKMFYWDF